MCHTAAGAAAGWLNTTVGPVIHRGIPGYGRIGGYFVSAHEYEELRRLRAFERRVFRIKELPVEIANAIKASKMDPGHNELNDLGTTTRKPEIV